MKRTSLIFAGILIASAAGGFVAMGQVSSPKAFTKEDIADYSSKPETQCSFSANTVTDNNGITTATFSWDFPKGNQGLIEGVSDLPSNKDDPKNPVTVVVEKPTIFTLVDFNGTSTTTCRIIVNP